MTLFLKSLHKLNKQQRSLGYTIYFGICIPLSVSGLFSWMKFTLVFKTCCLDYSDIDVHIPFSITCKIDDTLPVGGCIQAKCQNGLKYHFFL